MLVAQINPEESFSGQWEINKAKYERRELWITRIEMLSLLMTTLWQMVTLSINNLDLNNSSDSELNHNTTSSMNSTFQPTPTPTELNKDMNVFSSIFIVISCVSWLTAFALKNWNSYVQMQDVDYHLSHYQQAHGQHDQSIVLYRYQYLLKLAVQEVLIDQNLSHRVGNSILVEFTRYHFHGEDRNLLTNLEESINTTLGLIRGYLWYARGYLLASSICSLIAILLTLNTSRHFITDQRTSTIVLFSALLILGILSILSLCSPNGMLFRQSLRENMSTSMENIVSIENKVMSILNTLREQTGDTAYNQLLILFESIKQNQQQALPALVETRELLITPNYLTELPEKTTAALKHQGLFSGSNSLAFRNRVFASAANELKQDYNVIAKRVALEFDRLKKSINGYQELSKLKKFNNNLLPELLVKLNKNLFVITESLIPNAKTKNQKKNLKVLKNSINKFIESANKLQLRKEEYNKTQPPQSRLR